MKIQVYTIGKHTKPLLKELENEYIKRLRPFATVDCIELKFSISASQNPDNIKKDCTNFILSKFRGAGKPIILDEKGTQLTSQQFAEVLSDCRLKSISPIQFAIGSPYGWDRSLIPDDITRLSLSRMTFPSYLTRLILLEQIYRASTIISGSPYHNK